MPPLNEVAVDNAEVWLGSMTEGFAEATGAARALFTVTITDVEFTLSAGDPLSRTCSSNDQFPEMDKIPVDSEGLEPTMQEDEAPRSEYTVADGVFSSHWQV